MCGIAGFLGRRAADGLSAALESMKARGPDGRAETVVDGIRFGSVRLAIMDLENGGQPFSADGGRYILHGSGEIYNAPELREQLEKCGRQFASRCDLEVAVHAWAEWGESCIGRFNGMFAIAIWDRLEQTLHLFRDPCGQKPLLYWAAAGEFAFASEARALRAAGVPLTTDLRAIAGYLALRYVPEPATPWLGVRHLPPGHHLVVRPDREPVIRRVRPLVEAPVSLYDTSCDAVRIALRADTPAVLYLSGGVDSWMLAHGARRAGMSADSLTMDFPGNMGEGHAAAVIARENGFRHHRIPWQDSLIERLPNLVSRLESPVGDPLIVAFDALAEAARSLGAKVALSGEGPDEWFGGYGFHRAAGWAGRITSVGGPFPLTVLAGLAKCSGPLIDAVAGLRQNLGDEGRRRVAAWLRAWPGATPEERANGLRRLFTVDEVTAISLRSGWVDDLSLLEPLAGETLGQPLVHRALASQADSWLPAWAIGRHEKIALARGLEVRMPFLDPRLAAMTHPDAKRHWRRCAARAGWKRAQAPKQAFSIPAAALASSPAFTALADGYLSPSSVRARGWFDPQAVAGIGQRAREGSFLAAKQWAALLILEIWTRQQNTPSAIL